jgi:hypothetical protein
MASRYRWKYFIMEIYLQNAGEEQRTEISPQYIAILQQWHLLQPLAGQQTRHSRQKQQAHSAVPSAQEHLLAFQVDCNWHSK